MVTLDDKVDRIEETFEDFEYGYKELATIEAVDAVNKRLDQVEKRLDQLDRVESKLDQLLAAQNATSNGDSTDATDAARHVAEELGVDLAEVQGTGSGGQITVDDVRKKGEG